MNELISGKAAKLAWANGEDLEFKIEDNSYFYKWTSIMCRDADLSLSDFERNDIVFRLKPRTITLNGIEVPAHFEPEYNDEYFYLDSEILCGYGLRTWSNHPDHKVITQFGAWRSEEEIKQVVEALRSVFK